MGVGLMNKIYQTINKYKKTIIFSASFFIPAFLLLVVYKYADINPFGKLSLLIMDLDAQYIDFMIYLKRELSEGGSILFSWTKGGGGPIIDLFSYYLASPFNLLLLFFSEEKMYNAVLLLNILKIGLCGLSLSIFLNYKNKKISFGYIIFALIYALSTYSVAYSMCLMWFDALILLPVILIGVEKIIYEKKCILFVVSYVLMLFSNFYTCYMITIFVIIYFIYIFITANEKEFIKKASLLAICGVVSFLLLTWQFLPSIENMTAGKFLKGVSSSGGFFTSSADTFIKQLFLGQCNVITNAGGPNVYCSIIVTLLTVLYMTNPKIQIKEKIAEGAIIVIFILSFYINSLDIFWHMLQAPTWFPCRYAFLFIFFMIYIASKSLYNLKHISAKRILLTSAVSLLAYGVILFLVQNKITNITGALVSVALIIVYGILLTLSKVKIKRLAVLLLVITVSFEVFYNSYCTVHYLNDYFKYKNASEFEEYMLSLSEDIEKIKEADNGFYRIEKDFSRSMNDSMALNYNGISHYSSSYNKKYNQLARNLGLLQTHISVNYTGGTQVINTIFGIKYFFTKNPELYSEYNTLISRQNYSVMENTYFLPIGYSVNDYILEIDDFSDDYLQNQNLLTEAMCDIECFEKVTFETSSKAVDFIVSNKDAHFLATDNYKNKIVKMTVNDEEVSIPQLNNTRVYPLGKFNIGDKVSVTFKNSLSKTYLAALNMKRFNEVYKRLTESTLNVTEYFNNGLKGNINTDSDELLFTTITYDKNWKIEIDGKEVEPVLVLDTFIGVRVPEGQHEITFTYIQTSFYVGLLISFITLAVVIIVVLIKRKQKKSYSSANDVSVS